MTAYRAHCAITHDIDLDRRFTASGEFGKRAKRDLEPLAFDQSADHEKADVAFVPIGGRLKRKVLEADTRAYDVDAVFRAPQIDRPPAKVVAIGNIARCFRPDMIINVRPNRCDCFRDVIASEVDDDIAFEKSRFAMLDDAFGERCKLAVKYVVFSVAIKCAGLVEGRQIAH